jgi:hypothetical protein
VNSQAATVVFYAANVLYTATFMMLAFRPQAPFVTRTWTPLIHPLILAVPYTILAGPRLMAGVPNYFSLEGIATLMSDADIRLALWLDLMAIVPVLFSFVARDLVSRGASRVKIAVLVLLGSAAAPLGLAIFVVDKWLATRQAGKFEF